MSDQADHFLDPKPTQDLFTLPTGFLDDDGILHTKVHLREMTGIEEEVLAGKGELTPRLNKVVCNCLESIGETGIKPTMAIVKQLPVADRIFLLISLRRVSLGDTYKVKATCPSCSADHAYAIDLGELEVRTMVDPKVRTFEHVLPTGKTVTWHVMNGVDEDWLDAATKKLKGEGAITLAMLARIDSLEGEELVKDVTNRKGLVASVTALAKLSLRDRNDLRRTFEAHEANVDTDLQFTCHDCDYEFSASMRMEPQAFFFPSEM